MKSITLQMGGISRKYFVKYFLRIGGITEDLATFAGDRWQVQVGPEEWKGLGSIKLNYVFITFNVDEDRFDEFLAAFRLNFLKAGG